MSKISELSDGGVVQGGDTLIAVRSGGNVKVTYGGSTTANIDGGTIDDTVIGGTTPAAVTTTALVATTADINGGTIDGTVIGGTTAAAGTFTTGQFDTSVNVDGTVTADGLVVDGTVDVNLGSDGSPIVSLSGVSAGRKLDIQSFAVGASVGAGYSINATSGQGELDLQTTGLSRLNISDDGDISFYEDTGTTAKLFWSSGIESLGIGSSTLSNIGAAIQLINGGLFVSGDLTNTNVNGFTLGYDGTNAKLAVNGTSGASRGMTFGTVAGGNEHTRMTIEPTGNVGIGTSSPTDVLQISKSLATTGTGIVSPHGITLQNTSATAGNYTTIQNRDSGGSQNSQIQFINVTHGSPFQGAIAFTTRNSTGDFAERVRIDSSGNLLVGTTTQDSGAKFTLNDQGVVGLSFVETGTISHGRIYFKNGNGVVGQIITDGSATSYNTSSDYRLKENITDANDAGDKIDAIKVRQYDWKVDGSHQDYGMVAQELMTVAPEAVSGDPESDDMMGVDYSKLVPMMLKEIQSLRARVAQLEGAN